MNRPNLDHTDDGTPLLLRPHLTPPADGRRAREPLLPTRIRAGVRVRLTFDHTETGSVEQVTRQHFTDNLVLVAWDADRGDHDLYPETYLQIIGNDPNWNTCAA